jgi:ABC-type transport system involved in multi-copper enzyme maturation permease subunit
MFIGAAAAWTVAAARLSGADIPALFPSMLIWGGKAWIYSLSWLGLALGISHLMRSGSKATALGIVMLIVCSAAPLLIKRYAEEFSLLAYLFPEAAENSLWRSSLSAVTSASLWLIALGLLYLSAGIAYFLRRDAR